ncbi:MAG: FAD-dependent oxidoreductase, partial [Bacteroidales bacterium]|nr:FAD-dependent oxidoreductase [Bacteroidales bacterium]
MHKFDALIIGSGIGGLECAYILAKRGMKVCVVEKNPVVGGCLQSFRRGEDEFDTGFHYVGALGKGEILERLFSYFGLMELPWHQLDREGFDEVFFKERNYLLS